MDKKSLLITHSYRMLALSAGETAFLELAQRQAGQVFGVTSRGIFIRTAAGGLIFLSFEKFRGPLTINLAAPFSPFQALQIGEPVSTGENRLQIPAAHIEILAAPATVWRTAPPRRLEATPVTQRVARCASLAARLIAEKGNAGLSPILYDLLSLAGSATGDQIEPSVQPLFSLAHRLPARLRERDLPSIMEILVAFLGCGRGLTPSGDDFIMGLLLMLNRWPGSGLNGTLLVALNAHVIAAARQRTTSLSAALLACAAMGEADERLIAALDYLCTGQGDEGELVAGLAGWGASSGFDALAGMAAGLSEST